MKKFLTWISCCMLLSCLSVKAQSVIAFDSLGRAQYSLSMQYKKVGMTGICMMHKDSSEIVGSIVNEFGVKAFDFKFSIQDDKVKLFNVMSFLNKWYIKRTVKSDLQALFVYPGKNLKDRDISVSQDGEIKLNNIKRGIIYLFKRVEK